MLLETEGREEDLQLLILQNTGGWTLEGDASEQLEALYRQQSEDKLNDAMADLLALCRERWQQLKRTTALSICFIAHSWRGCFSSFQTRLRVIAT